KENAKEGDNDVQVIEHRVDDLRHLHASGRIMLAQAEQSGTAAPNLLEGLPIDQTPPADVAAPPTTPSNQMVVMDAVVLRVSDTGKTSKGNNLFDNFTALISPGTYASAWAKTRLDGAGAGTGVITPGGLFSSPSAPTATFDPSAAGGTSFARAFTQGISFGTISYSMRIANSTKSRVEVVGRPTLVASIGKKASFFSGVELLLGLTGQFGGTITKTPVGITLELTLNNIENGRANIDVVIYGSLIADSTALAGNVTTGFSQIGISRIQTTISVGLGETIMLGGITERNDVYNKSGFPGLQDVPGLQYLFSNETTLNERKSVMYLITPRSYGDTVRDVRSHSNTDDRRFNLSELEQRNKDWYDPRGNSAIIMRTLGPLYREFRTGDIKPIDWYYPDKVEDQISELGRFMYF
ncbi:MAG: type II and III secretion system protein, partial [Alphaproteobacteria bacterium]|nr:type II and III secretion system protein [Alphaproteobacteria bacterium]